MINNRQNGRRRGRGGPRPPNGSNNAPERGNRLDNRARGNANQLHEKYKTLARDAQLQGDRVMTEYYLQFADHYFRVLGESRQRFEEQRRYRDDGGDYDEDGGEDGEMNAGYDDDGQQDYRPAPRQNEGRQNDQRQGNGQGNDGRQNGARQNDGRQNDGRQTDGRQYEPRQNEARQNDGNRNDNGRNDGGRNEGRQDEPRQSETRQDARPPRDRQQQEPRRRDNRPSEPRVAEPRPAERPIDGAGQERQSEMRPADPPASVPLAGEQSGEGGAPAERVRRPRVRRDRTEPSAAEAGDAVPERIEIDRLPPAFTPPAAVTVSPGDAPAEAAEAPRRRRLRRPSTDVAPVDA